MDGAVHSRRNERNGGVWLAACLAMALLGGLQRARAQDAPQAEDTVAAPGYAEAIREAVEAYSAGQWRNAQQAFARAHALHPSARTFRGLGLSAFYLGELAAARLAFEQALAETRRPLPEDQRRELVELLREATQATARIELRVAPAMARVELDGVATEPGSLILERGEHVLVVSAEGYVSQRMTLEIAGGEQRSLDFALQAQAVSPAPVGTGAGATVPSRTASPSGTSAGPALAPARGRVFTWIAAAAVPVFAGSAAVVWFTGKAKRDAIEHECARDFCDHAEAERRLDRAGVDAHETWTNVAWGAAGTALVASAVLFFVEDEQGSRSNVEISADRAGAVLRGQF